MAECNDNSQCVSTEFSRSYTPFLRGRLQRTSGKWGGGGFEISEIPGRGEGVVCESSDVRTFTL